MTEHFEFDSTTPEGELLLRALRGDEQARLALPHHSTVLFSCLCTDCVNFKAAAKLKVTSAAA